MKRILFFLMFWVLSLCMVSCDTGNDGNNYSSDIIGTWAWLKDFSESDGWDYWEEGDDIEVVIFEKGGDGYGAYYTVDSYGDYELDDTEYFNWEIKGNTLTVESPYESEISSTILLLDDEELVIEWMDDDENMTLRSYYIRIDED